MLLQVIASVSLSPRTLWLPAPVLPAFRKPEVLGN